MGAIVLQLIRKIFQKGRIDPGTQTDRRRSEGGYLLVLGTIIVFALIANYLLGQKTSQPEKVQMSYLIEPVGRELSATEAFERFNRGEFKAYEGGTETLDLGYMREGVWVLMQFSNTANSGAERFVLQLRHTYINGSFTPVEEIPGFSGGGSFRLGETQPFTDKLLPRTQGFHDIRHVSFPFNVGEGREFRALVRLRAHVMSVPFLLLAEREFLSSIVREMVVTASFFGGLMLLAVYNMMVGLARRENEFLFYGIYISTISLMIVAINGSGHMFIWPDMLWFHYNSANLLTNVCCFSYLAFTLSLFKEAPPQGFERLIWNFLFFFCTTGIVLQIAEGGFYASIVANLVVLGTLCASLVRAWRVRPVYGRLANLFLISEGMLFLGAVIYCIKMFGWLTSTPFTLNIVTLAATLEGILLSFVLSEKMRRTMIEREVALERLAAAQEHLESSVRDKTLALAAKYTSHEVLNPVFALRLKAERIRDEIVLRSSEEEVRRFPAARQILRKVNEMFRLIDSIIHTIRAIKTLSSDGMREEVVDVDIADAFADALRLLEAKTFQVQASIESEFSESHAVKARRSDVVQVLMNLLSNSLDALVNEDTQWIQVKSSVWYSPDQSGRPMIEISVCDSGAGPCTDIRDRLFDSEVTTKDAGQGMGLGLAFCQKLVRRNDGQIGFDAASPRTRFYFRLPAASQALRSEEPIPLRRAG